MRRDPSEDAVWAAARRLMSGFSVEVTPRETARLDAVARMLAPGAAVYVTHLATVGFDQVLDTARQVRARGLRPVVHLAVRAIPDMNALDRALGRLVDEGVSDLLLIAGSMAPSGEIGDTLQVLESIALRRRAFAGIGVAGHPEGNPGVDPGLVERALARKHEIVAEFGLPLHVVTQFGFSPEPILRWEQRMRDDGIDLPVHVGLPGLTTPAKLVRFGLSCGVGPSLAVLRKQSRGVLTLATQEYRPADTVAGIARAVAADPDSLISALHFFPFGAVLPTAAWATAIGEGRFALAEDGALVTDVDRGPAAREIRNRRSGSAG
jgi:methylenetetrahydrofolate reductase (NADPH)